MALTHNGTINYNLTRVLGQGSVAGMNLDDAAHFSDISVASGWNMFGGGQTFSGCIAGPWPWAQHYPWIRCVDQVLGLLRR